MTTSIIVTNSLRTDMILTFLARLSKETFKCVYVEIKVTLQLAIAGAQSVFEGSDIFCIKRKNYG